MFKMIRSVADFRLVILVTPADAGPDTPGAKYYHYATWHVGIHAKGIFGEITRAAALDYFCRHADGSGFSEHSQERFPTIEAATAYVEQKRQEHHARLRQTAESTGQETDG